MFTKTKMILIGKNLGERHRDLNSKVVQAVVKQTNFDELKSQPDQCDVDKLFKIDLASKYKKVDYILDVLKSGDEFYITRTLKCLWLYSDEFSQFINSDYLDTNIFSRMSEKMKRKMLTSISIHMKNTDRAVDFYKYCKRAKLNNCAVKFLINTPHEFKLEALEEDNFCDFDDSKFLKQFIGNSFVLALAYIEVYEYYSDIICELRFLYFVSDEGYLNILEGHIQTTATQPYCSKRLGIRISKDILKRHKMRIVNKPLLYINILNKSMLLKHLTVEDVKTLILSLLPKSSKDFWSVNFYYTYKFILTKIPKNELFHHVKQIYDSKYTDTFEIRVEFYNMKYYEMLNIDEREAWALEHIKRDKEMPGIKNYIWYKFVSLQKAFTGIKHHIFITQDKNERSQILNILPETARNMEDIHKILCYYYDRHVNESEEHKESFINTIIEFHDIYSFSSECWTSLDKLLYSLEVYEIRVYNKKEEYKVRSIFYHILHSMDLPEAIKEYIQYPTRFFFVTSLIEELSEERKAIIAQFLLNCYAEKMRSLMNRPNYNSTKDDKEEVQDLVTNIWSVIANFQRNNEDYPEVAVKFMEANMDIYKYHDRFRVEFVKRTEGDFVRWLKQDIQMAVDGIGEVRCNTYRWNFRLCRLFRKLKTYFLNDVAKEYLQYFMHYLMNIPEGGREYRNIKMAVVGIFYLADPDVIINLLDNNVPASPRIDHDTIDNRVLQVQKAICRLAYHTRPPLPLANIQKYIVGDYVHYCLPVFHNYLANLQSKEKFIEVLIDCPLSIQKHGLRLAYKAYNTDKLIPIIKKAWEKTKNVSLRKILYETLFKEIINASEEVQRELFEVLKLYTSELNYNDHDNVFLLLVSDDLPDMFKGDFIEAAWLTVSKLPNKTVDIERKIHVIGYMEKYIHLMERDFPRLQIIDNHVNDMLYEKKIKYNYDEYHIKELISAKWQLCAKYIISFTNEDEQGKSLELLQTIMSHCIKSWKLVKGKTYIVQRFMKQFIKTITNKDPNTAESCRYTVFVYQCILDNLQKCIKTEDMYLMNWELQLSITSRNIIYRRRNKFANEGGESISKEIANAYGKAVAEMLIGHVKNNKFYSCFYHRLADIVNNIGRKVCSILGINTRLVYDVCDVLTDIKMVETHVLALIMLPGDPHPKWETKHRQTIGKLKQFDSQEVRSYLYEKFVLSDYQVRTYATAEHSVNACDVL